MPKNKQPKRVTPEQLFEIGMKGKQKAVPAVTQTTFDTAGEGNQAGFRALAKYVNRLLKV